MKGSDRPMEETMSEPALTRDDMTQADLRHLADRLLETTRVEYVDEGVLLLIDPPAAEHRAIVRLIVKATIMAVAQGATAVGWAINSENYQGEFPDEFRRFFIPDVVVTLPGTRTPKEERASIVPVALLVDQERTAWSLHGVAGNDPGCQLPAAGVYGESVPLPAPFGFPIPTAEWPRQQQ
jgi:hypothetical protein